MGWALNPDTLDLERMTKAEATDLGWRWWTRKPLKATLDRAKKTESPIAGTLDVATHKAAQTAKRKATSTVARSVESTAKKALTGSGVTVAGLTQAAGVVGAAAIAAAVGYFLGTAAMPATVRLAKAERQTAVNNAYRHARLQLAQKLGRPATLAELAPLTAAWKAESAKVASGTSYYERG